MKCALHALIPKKNLVMHAPLGNIALRLTRMMKPAKLLLMDSLGNMRAPAKHVRPRGGWCPKRYQDRDHNDIGLIDWSETLGEWIKRESWTW